MGSVAPALDLCLGSPPLRFPSDVSFSFTLAVQNFRSATPIAGYFLLSLVAHLETYPTSEVPNSNQFYNSFPQITLEVNFFLVLCPSPKPSSNSHLPKPRVNVTYRGIHDAA